MWDQITESEEAKKDDKLDYSLTSDMEREMLALRQELDETRKVLRTQTARCRKLVAAFTARLRQKEQEERQGRELRDQQLSTVLRALLVLEARLRKEQREIQRQLQERDAVIRSQTLEIARLRRAARSDSPRKQHRNDQPIVLSNDKQENDVSLVTEHGVQHIIKKLEKETQRSGNSVKFDERSIKHTRRPLSADMDSKIENGLNFSMKNGSVTKSLDNLDSCDFSNLKMCNSKSNHAVTESCDSPKTRRGHGSLDSLLQDNIDSETSEATVVEIRVVDEYNQRNTSDTSGKGKRFIKRQVLKSSDCSLNRFKANRQKEVLNNEELVTKLDCEETYGMDPVLDNDSGVFQGSSSEVSDSSLKSDCQDTSYHDHDDDLPNRDLYKDYQHNPVLECVSQILLRDEDDMMDSSMYRSHPDDNDRIEDLKKGRFNNLWPSIKEEQESQTEEEDDNDTTVIQQTTKANEIDGKIREDIQTVPHGKATETVPDIKCDLKKSPLKDKTPSPPIKAQHLQEKACLLMSNQRLTLVRNPDLEEVDKKEENESKLRVTYQKAKASVLPSQVRSSVPPALPPKPPQLGSLSRLRHKRNVLNSQLNQSPHPIHLNPVTATCNDVKRDLVHTSENSRESSEKCFESLNKPKASKLHDIHVNYSQPIHQEKPRQRQILSNGSLKRALNHETVPQELRQYNHDHQEINTSKSFDEKLDEMNLSSYRRPVKVVGPVAARVQRQLEARPTLHDSNRHQYLQDGIGEDQNGNKPASSSHGTNCGTIKVGCSVSSLITGSTGGSIVTELTQGSVVLTDQDQQQDIPSRQEEAQHQCNTEHRNEDNDGDEDGNATLRSNFEEFRLEDVDMDSVEEVGRPAGDGAECRTSQPSQNGNATAGSYEHFLEATGLSQKSIMTPSRMLSNHRNVIKPKDVKHRSRVLRAAAVNERCGSVGNGPIVKYWIEPFL